MQINLGKPQVGLTELMAVSKVLRSKNLSQGDEVRGFELEFSKIVGERNCVAVNSGTSALHLAITSLGIGPGDQVILPSFTFAATANSVRLAGAEPIFVDIDYKSFNIDPDLITNAITKKTRAIIVVHLYGLPANMDKILQISARYKLLVIEDSAQAHLAQIGNRQVGTFGNAAAFSFYATKNMTTAEGGMVVFEADADAKYARMLRNQGMERRYENEIVGFNLRMTEIQAAIGRVQLKKLPRWTDMRINNANYFDGNLQGYVDVPSVPVNFKHVYHQYTIKVPAEKRTKLMNKLNSNGIQTGIYYPNPVHTLKPFLNQKFELPITTLSASQVLSIPIHPKLNKRQLRYMVKKIIEGVS
jgi:perosamine synthetase